MKEWRRTWQSPSTQQGAPEQRLTIGGAPYWAEWAGKRYFHHAQWLAGKSMTSAAKLRIPEVLWLEANQLILFLTAALRVLSWREFQGAYLHSCHTYCSLMNESKNYFHFLSHNFLYFQNFLYCIIHFLLIRNSFSIMPRKEPLHFFYKQSYSLMLKQ